MRLLVYISFIVDLAGISFPAISQIRAGDTYVLDPRIQVHDLRGSLAVMVDTPGRVPDTTILSGRLDEKFTAFSQASALLPGNTTYWLKFSVRSLTPVQNWWLLLRDSLTAGRTTAQNCYTDVFYTDHAHRIIKHQRTGYLVKRSQKLLKSHAGFSGVIFTINANDIYTVYIKIRNEFDSYNVLCYATIHNPVVPATSGTQGEPLKMLFLIALVFSVISFFFFFFVKERSYLFFALYTLFLSHHYLILHYDLPFVDVYIPEHPWLIRPAWQLLTIGGFILFLLFGRSFINLHILSKRTDRWLKYFIFSWIAATAIEIILTITLYKYSPTPAISYFFLFGCLCFIIRLAFLKSMLARIYFVGALWLICFTILGLLDNTKVIRLPINPWMIGQVGQLLIFAAGLAYKIRLNEKARAEADKIREMDEIKSKFFANISHEFRTPLTLIQGPLQQIESESTNKQKQGMVEVPYRHINTMRRNTDRLLELVNQLLDLSKLDSGNMKLQVIKGDVLQLLKAIAGSFDSMAERKGIHYHLHFPELSHIAFFDKDKLEKIFSNLIANALKYTPEKGTVSIDVVIDDERIRISVEDSGTGIQKKELDKIFDRFYRMEITGENGSGIGLALVKELVDLYKGQISVTSEPGKGSRFRVSLPVSKAAFDENELVYGKWLSEDSFVDKTLAIQKITSPVNGITHSQLPLLLVVEDNTDLRQFIVETAYKQYNIIEAVNGKAGLEKACAEIPDIILSDVMMPVMDGFELTSALKKDEKTSHIPVILLTAKAGQQHKVTGLQTGADDYLTKPFDAMELLTRLQNLVNQRKLLRRKFAGEVILKPSEITSNSADEIFISKVMNAVEMKMEDDDFGVEQLASEVAMSRSQLHRKLIAITGQAPSEILRTTRLLRAKELLTKKVATPSEVAYKVGFASHTYFSKCFKEEFGVSPSEVGGKVGEI